MKAFRDGSVAVAASSQSGKMEHAQRLPYNKAHRQEKRVAIYPRYVSTSSRVKAEWNPTLVLLIMALLILMTVFAAREWVTGTPGF